MYKPIEEINSDQIIEELKILLQEKDLYKKDIDDHLHFMIVNCEDLTFKTNIDKLALKIVMFYNNLRLKYESDEYKPIYEEYNNFYNDVLKNLIFQKNVLVELRKKLFKTRETENYDRILLETELLYKIFDYDNKRREQNHIDHTVIKCKYNSINYIPAQTESLSSNCKQHIKKLCKDINNK